MLVNKEVLLLLCFVMTKYIRQKCQKSYKLSILYFSQILFKISEKKNSLKVKKKRQNNSHD
jgi:hypothetical protein